MADGAEERECPFCKESIKADAVKCRYCGSRIEQTTVEHEGVCPFCKEEIKPGAIKCRYCHSHIGPAPAIRAERMAPRQAGGKGDCGCGCGGGYPPRRFASQRLAYASPASDWWSCVDYCFLLNIGDEAATDQCVAYRCGDYPLPPDFRV